ncbi:MAG: signal peptidase I [Bacilli bacterium]|nr:signal peptidase I [Bacilli bacterium]
MEKFKYIFKEYISYILIILVVLFMKYHVITPIHVRGDSMLNTLHNGDIMLLNIIGYQFKPIKRFDIVVVREDKEWIIKRVIGLPGEEIEYKDNQLYVNGKKVKDKYPSKKTGDFKVKVAEGYYFVLGDNRTNSADSRVFGSFPRKSILGKTNFTIFPFHRFGNKE